ncbi:MAG: hypothetical protein CO032_02995 [Nitrosopumilales archaeon CG_4_9_14_0_2_um_filter_34_16]|nr:MAG: hypothetical protein CO032_02995 [Nitrosopumilales archaeon CG_4_9_14_0_2_um_filter_34_16]
MVSYTEHLKNILSQILDSYQVLNDIQDKPGDLVKIKKEMLKMNGFIKVVCNNIDEYTIQQSDFKKVKSKLKYYLENYFFEKEMETMSALYSDDNYRLKNMRLKIIEALDDQKMIEDLGDLIKKL